MEPREIFESAVRWCYEFQDVVTARLEEMELQAHPPGQPHRPAVFREDLWDHSEPASFLTGGGGRSRAIEGGRIFEKGGVNVSDVSGRFSAEVNPTAGDVPRFRAAGFSLVLHPANPHAPAIHANFRMIKRISEKGDVSRLWFGGGVDLTPHLLYEEDAVEFHRVWKNLCARFPDIANYDRMKRECDRYFYLSHRKEARGIGGIFYDQEEERSERWLAFMKEAGEAFLKNCLPLLERRASTPFTDQERDFQLYRRGRYVEFNLMHDRGTLFGLQAGGRIESVLMTLPSPVHWRYNYDAENDEKLEPALRERIRSLYEVLRCPISWSEREK